MSIAHNSFEVQKRIEKMSKAFRKDSRRILREHKNHET
jgi:hypothetical protein